MKKDKDFERIEVVKFNMSMRKSIFDEVEKYADELGLSRSAFITLCCSQYLVGQKSVSAMTSLTSAMRQLADSKQIDISDLKQIDDFEILVDSLKNLKNFGNDDE